MGFWEDFKYRTRHMYATNKYQLSLANPRDALHHGSRAANKGGRSV